MAWCLVKYRIRIYSMVHSKKNSDKFTLHISPKSRPSGTLLTDDIYRPRM